MKNYQRAKYLAYYLKKLDKPALKRFLKYSSHLTGRKKSDLLTDMLGSVFKYNISILEYFQFGFYDRKEEDKKTWAGTGTMYEYQLKMNPVSKREILDDKRKFVKVYNQFVKHKTASVEELKTDNKLIDEFLNNSSKKIVLKAADGKCGAQVAVKDSGDFNPNNLVAFMEKNQYDLIEEFIEQHADLNRLSPSGVNTVRIITQLDKNDNVVILGCRQRISVNSAVDNMGAGNIVASIDETTGRINSKAFYNDITKESVAFHPITGVEIMGFQVPFWKESLQLAKDAALLSKQNRSIGWDIVITENGPGLIEGNHDWCKLVWQMPVQKGLKPILDKHLNELKNV